MNSLFSVSVQFSLELPVLVISNMLFQNLRWISYNYVCLISLESWP